MTDSSVYFDPYDVDINADPYPTYARLREEAPVYYNERYDFWALSRHDDVQQALVNWQTFSNTRSDILDIIKAGHRAAARRDPVRGPADAHDAPRSDVAGVHAPRAWPRSKTRCARSASACLDPLVGADGFDIVAELGVDDADARDRHAARHPRAGPGGGPQQDRRQPAHQPGQPME